MKNEEFAHYSYLSKKKLPNRNLYYRADIDGLRAIAIIAVILYHVSPGRLPHGYLGVDIFFVISGFLITRIILNDLRAGTFSFLHFLARRAARLFPALLAVFALATLLAFVILTDVEMQEFLSQLIAGALYVSNIYYYMQTGYFEPEAISQPFLHLWSLAVEEQFYLFIPPLLLLTWRLGGIRAVGPMLLLLAAASLASALLVRNSALAFFITWFRAWEFIAGSLLALAALHYGWHGFSRPVANVLAPIGLLMLLIIMLTPGAVHHPGSITIFAVAGTMLLIASPASALSRHVLSWRPVVFIGLISYVLYLWHYPLLSLMDYAFVGGTRTRQQKLIYLAVVVALAVATHYLLERPARTNPVRTARLVTPLLLFFAAGALLMREAHVGTLFTDKLSTIATRAARDWHYPGQLHELSEEGKGVYVNRLGHPVEVVFLGDSHAQQYAPRVTKLTLDLPQKVRTISFVTGPGCPPMKAFFLLRSFFYRDCVAARPRMIRHLQRHANSIKTVILAGAWNKYFLDNLAMRRNQGRIFCNGKKLGVDHPDYTHCMLNGLQEFLRQVRHILPYAKIVFLLDNPVDERFSPRPYFMHDRYEIVPYRIAQVFSAKRQSFSFDNLPTLFLQQRAQKKLSFFLRKNLQSKVDEMLNPAARICPEGICSSLFTTSNNPWYKYKDDNHLSATYAKTFDMLDHLLLKEAIDNRLGKAGDRL